MTQNQKNPYPPTHVMSPLTSMSIITSPRVFSGCPNAVTVLFYPSSTGLRGCESCPRFFTEGSRGFSPGCKNLGGSVRIRECEPPSQILTDSCRPSHSAHEFLKARRFSSQMLTDSYRPIAVSHRFFYFLTCRRPIAFPCRFLQALHTPPPCRFHSDSSQSALQSQTGWESVWR